MSRRRLTNEKQFDFQAFGKSRFRKIVFVHSVLDKFNFFFLLIRKVLTLSNCDVTKDHIVIYSFSRNTILIKRIPSLTKHQFSIFPKPSLLVNRHFRPTKTEEWDKCVVRGIVQLTVSEPHPQSYDLYARTRLGPFKVQNILNVWMAINNNRKIASRKIGCLETNSE